MGGSWLRRAGQIPDLLAPAWQATGESGDDTQRRFKRRGEVLRREISWSLLSPADLLVRGFHSSLCVTSMITSVVIRRNFTRSSSPWTSATFGPPPAHKGSEALMKVPGLAGRTGIKIEYFRLPNWNSILSPSFGHSTIYVRTSIAKIDILETTIWLLALSWKNLTYISYIVIYNIYSYISIYNYIFLEFLRSQFLFFLHS